MTSSYNAAPLAPELVDHLALEWVRAWNGHDADAVAELCTDDLVYDEPAIGRTVHGRAAIRDFVAAMFARYPDGRFTGERPYVSVDREKIIIAWHFSGTRRLDDDAPDGAPSGPSLAFYGDDHLELRDGLISAYRCIYDHADVLRQIGTKSSL